MVAQGLRNYFQKTLAEPQSQRTSHRSHTKAWKDHLARTNRLAVNLSDTEVARSQLECPHTDPRVMAYGDLIEQNINFIKNEKLLV